MTKQTKQAHTPTPSLSDTAMSKGGSLAGYKLMEVEVVDIRIALGDGKLRAYANVKFNGQMICKGFTVVKGEKGLFIKMPAKASKNGLWVDMIVFDDFLKHEVEKTILKAYEKEISTNDF